MAPPTIITTLDGYAIIIRTRENPREPAHVHVRKAGEELRVSIAGGEISELTNSGLGVKETRRALEAVAENYDVLVEAWEKYHG